MDKRSMAEYSAWGLKESDMTEWLNTRVPGLMLDAVDIQLWKT